MALPPRRPLPPPEPGAPALGAIPPVVLVLFLALAAVEAALSLAGMGLVGGPGSVGWRVGLIERWGVTPALWDHLAQRGFVDGRYLPNLLLYGLVHWDAMHALFAGALLLALGKFVADAMGGGAMLAVFLLSLLGGAVAYGMLAPPGRPLFGAYPGVYGLIGAFTYALWLRIGREGGNRLTAFRLIAVLLAIQFAFGLLFGSDPGWIGDVGGFAAGFLVAPLLVPGGLAALRARLRER